MSFFAAIKPDARRIQCSVGGTNIKWIGGEMEAEVLVVGTNENQAKRCGSEKECSSEGGSGGWSILCCLVWLIYAIGDHMGRHFCGEPSSVGLCLNNSPHNPYPFITLHPSHGLFFIPSPLAG